MRSLNMFDEEPAAGNPEPSLSESAPLATRMRPWQLSDFVGQESVVGTGTVLRRAIEEDRLTSLIFWGPPGCGKSTLASIIAHQTSAAFENYSAVTAGVNDIRRVIERAQARHRRNRQRTILFIDEIHRWNRSQQDALLPHVENGTIVLIGATTENPYFEVNTPLLSRSRVFRLEPLSIREIRQLLELALADKERGLGNLTIEVEPAALDLLSEMADGDARLALNALEVAAQSANPDAQGRLWVSTELAAEAAQARILSYDKSGDEHYDTISAFIKSVRGSDPDAAVYWLAKMLISGEDPRFIARRLVILASEDIGNADPLGLVMANAAAQAAMFIGLPEAELTLAQATTYLAGAPKSNSSTIAISRAKAELSEHGALPVPPYLRDAHYRAAKRLGHGEGYRYPHDYPGNFVPQKYLPDKVQGLPFYEPSENGAEAEIKQRLALWRERMRAGEKADESE